MKAARLHLFLPKTWTQGIRKIVAVSLCFLLTWLPALAQTQGQPPQTAESTSAQVPLTNKDVLDLFKMGLSEDIIIAKIRSTPSKFDTSPAALQELITANVPQSVILAMILGNVEASPAQATRVAEAPTPGPAKTKVEIPDGTPVELELVENVSSEAVQEGSLIDFSVVQPVVIDGVTVIERGAPARGRVVEVKKARHWGRAGKLVWSIQDVHSVDGQRLPLRLTKELEGGGSSGKVAAAVVVTAIFFWPAAPVWGLKKGKPAIIPAGTRVSSFAHGESTVEATVREAEQK